MLTPVFLTRTQASSESFFNQTIIRNQHAAVGEFSQQSYTFFYFTSTHINRYRMVEREKERATHTKKKQHTKSVEGSFEIFFWKNSFSFSVSFMVVKDTRLGFSSNRFKPKHKDIFNNFCASLCFHKNTLHIYTSRQVL